MTPLDKDGVLVPYQENFINLLLVEDKEQCRINFISKFRQMNFEVETFINCSEAQKRLDDENQPSIDFLVIDADVVNGIDGISFPIKLKNSIHARHLFTIWVDPKSRDDCMNKLQKSNIGVAVNFRAIHLLDYFKRTFNFKPGMFPNAELIGNSTITLPMYCKLKDIEVNYVTDKVISIIKGL